MYGIEEGFEMLLQANSRPTPSTATMMIYTLLHFAVDILYTHNIADNFGHWFGTTLATTLEASEVGN